MSEWISEQTTRSPRRTRSSIPPAPASLCFELVVLEGPDAGKQLTIDAARGSILLGTSAVCGVRMSDSFVAARQCALEVSGEHLRLVDLSADKSTRVNGILAHEVFLAGGEILRVGATVISVRRSEVRTAGVPLRSSFGRIHGEHAEMVALYSIFAALAHESAPLLIAGERGTGKRLLAEELHAHGPFHTGPFVVVPRRDPRAVTPALLDSARGGTLYVEEAADLDRATLTQIVALADIRVILGTRGERPVALEIRRGVTLPPLRERLSDVAYLARKLWAELGGEGSLPDDFGTGFEDRTWPGNVRELRLAVQDRVVHGGRGDAVSGVFDMLAPGAPRSSAPPPPDSMTEIVESELPFGLARGEVLAEFERRYVTRALDRAGNNVGRAAANSGIAHRYFQVLNSRRKSA